jgi:hypothetical protein
MGRFALALFAFGIALGMAPDRVLAQDAAATVAVDTGQRIWRIPYPYLSIRPPPGPLPAVVRVPGFSFAFWMPDGLTSTLAGHESPSLRPPEPGRPPPGPNDYLVIGTNVRAWSDPGAQPHPARQLDNLISDGSANYEYRERWGLIEIVRRPGLPANFDFYYGTRLLREPGLMQASVLVRCARLGRPGNDEFTINRLCTGTVALNRLDVLFHVQLPMERMDQVMDAVAVAARLLDDWADPGSLSP